MKKWLWIFLLGIWLPGISQTQYEISLQANMELRQVDQELNNIYGKIRFVYRDDTLFLKKLKQSQLAWISFRDLYLESLFPSQDKQAFYGSVFTMCYALRAAEITRERIRQLRLWLDGTEEGNVCSGSVKSAIEIEERLKKYPK